MTISEAQKLIKAKGFEPNPCSDWEDRDHVYCFSKECFANQSYRPKLVVHYCKQSGVLELIANGNETSRTLSRDPGPMPLAA